MSDNILFGIRLSETSSVFPLCLAELLVLQTGLEPVRVLPQGIFVLLYVTIADLKIVVVWTLSLPYAFTLRQLVYSLYAQSL